MKNLGTAFTQVGFGVPSGWWLPNSYSFSGQTAAPVANTVSILPFAIHYPQTFQALAVQQMTAGAGGAGIVCKLALYGETNGLLDMTTPLEQGDISITTTGKKSITFTRTLQPGVYWGAFLYAYSTAPSTAPAFSMSGNNGLNLPFADTFGVNQVVRGWRFTGVSALPTSLSTMTISGNADCPILALRAA